MSCATHARTRQKGLLIFLDEQTQQVRRNTETLGINIVGEEKNGKNIVLAYDRPLELNLDEHLQTIKKLVENHQVKRVVIDSLASFELVRPQEARGFFFGPRI